MPIKIVLQLRMPIATRARSFDSNIYVVLIHFPFFRNYLNFIIEELKDPVRYVGLLLPGSINTFTLKRISDAWLSLSLPCV